MAVEVLARQAMAEAKQSGEAFKDALESVLKTEAGRQLRELRDGPHRGEMAPQWQGDLARGRRRERAEAAWEQFYASGGRAAGIGIAKGEPTRLTCLRTS